MPQTWVKQGTFNLGRTAWGSAAIPPVTLALGGTYDIVVTLNRAMPSTTYGATPVITATNAALLSLVTIRGVIARTTTTVTVRVVVTAVLSAGANVEVTATA